MHAQAIQTSSARPFPSQGLAGSPVTFPRVAPAARNDVGLADTLALLGLPASAAGDTPALSFMRRKVAAGQSVFRQGDPCGRLHVVRLGTFKSVLLDENGTEQVLGFRLRGDLLGSDGLADGVHASGAVALEDSEVIVIDVAELQRAGCVDLERALYRLTSRELVGQHAALSTMGTLGAEARVARLLWTLSERYARLGYSSTALVLRMTRREIASHLGVTLETVSRALTSLVARGVIDVDQREIAINDRAALRGAPARSAEPRAPRAPRRSGVGPRSQSTARVALAA